MRGIYTSPPGPGIPPSFAPPQGTIPALHGEAVLSPLPLAAATTCSTSWVPSQGQLLQLDGFTRVLAHPSLFPTSD